MTEHLNEANARYILFLIDSKIKQHDGKIFSSYTEAKDYAVGCLDGIYANKAVIGYFLLDPNVKEMSISLIETIGFTGDKKDIRQLDLFKSDK